MPKPSADQIDESMRFLYDAALSHVDQPITDPSLKIERKGEEGGLSIELQQGEHLKTTVLFFNRDELAEINQTADEKVSKVPRKNHRKVALELIARCLALDE